MVILYKSQAENDVILSVYQLLKSENPELELKVKSDFNHKDYSIALGNNFSSFPERYLLFRVASGSISNWEEGLYTYQLYDNSEISGSVIETGTIRVKDSQKSNSPIFISTDESSDDLIVYQHNN